MGVQGEIAGLRVWGELIQLHAVTHMAYAGNQTWPGSSCFLNGSLVSKSQLNAIMYWSYAVMHIGIQGKIADLKFRSERSQLHAVIHTAYAVMHMGVGGEIADLRFWSKRIWLHAVTHMACAVRHT